MDHPNFRAAEINMIVACLGPNDDTLLINPNQSYAKLYGSTKIFFRFQILYFQ